MRGGVCSCVHVGAWVGESKHSMSVVAQSRRTLQERQNWTKETFKVRTTAWYPGGRGGEGQQKIVVRFCGFCPSDVAPEGLLSCTRSHECCCCCSTCFAASLVGAAAVAVAPVVAASCCFMLLLQLLSLQLQLLQQLLLLTCRGCRGSGYCSQSLHPCRCSCNSLCCCTSCCCCC